MEHYRLEAAPRTLLGKQKVKRLKQAGYLPAVIYGRGIEPTPLQVSAEAFEEMLKSVGHSVMVDLAIEGASAPTTVVVKKIQRDPLTRGILNVDFHKVSETDRITSRVAVHVVGESPGVAAGGSLLQTVSELDIRGPAGSLPTHLEADVSGVGLGEALHVRDLRVPEGVEILAPADEAVVVVHARRGAEAEEEPTAEAEEEQAS